MTNNRVKNTIKVCLAGATGWAGSALAKEMLQTGDIELVSAVSRQNAGKNLMKLLGLKGKAVPVFATVEEALSVPCNVFFDYTKAESAKQHIFSALRKGLNVVIGTSGLTNEDYAEIELLANQLGRSVLAVGNFAISVVLLYKFAALAARYMKNWEIIDYAHQDKPDAPSGSARELAYNLSQVHVQSLDISLEKTQGIVEARGAALNQTQVYSVRLPGFVISLEVIFGNDNEKLIIRHDAGSNAAPYVGGALLAIRSLDKFKGLKRGMEDFLSW